MCSLLFFIDENAVEPLPNCGLCFLLLQIQGSIIHSKKSFWVSTKILSTSLPQFFQTLLNPADKRISSPIPILFSSSGTESGFVCLMLPYNHRQRKSRNLSYTNQFKPSRSLTSTEKTKENQQRILLFQLGNRVKKRNAECPRYQINSLQKFQLKNSIN